VVSPLVIPRHADRLTRVLNTRLLGLAVGRAVAGLGIEHPILWSYVPQAEVLLDRLAPTLVVYHCVDDIAAQEGVDADSFRAAEERFVARADLVLASAPQLAERLSALRPDVHFVPNVADTDSFAQALDPGPVDPALAALPAPRIVFTGAISDTKVDMALIAAVARRHPAWSFALVGPVGLGAPRTDVSSLAAEPNVHLLGQRAYAQLPAVLRGADAGLIPYRRTALTDSIFPMKVYEYLAAGLPVVATDLPSLRQVEAVARAGDAAGFGDALARAVAEDTADRRRERSAAARRYSWTARLTELDEAVAAAERRAR
jgi:glycosyltransferase involved in cell wall biosynthesis